MARTELLGRHCAALKKAGRARSRLPCERWSYITLRTRLGLGLASALPPSFPRSPIPKATGILALLPSCFSVILLNPLAPLVPFLFLAFSFLFFVRHIFPPFFFAFPVRM